MAKNIRGNHDGKNGRNESYFIPGRGDVSRPKLVKEVESGRHPDFHVYQIGKKKFVSSNPDGTPKNNINQ